MCSHPPTSIRITNTHWNGWAKSKWIFLLVPFIRMENHDWDRHRGKREREIKELKQKVWSEWIELRWNYFLSLGLNFLAYVYTSSCDEHFKEKSEMSWLSLVPYAKRFCIRTNPKMWLFKYVRHWYIVVVDAVVVVITKRIILSITFVQELSINFRFLKLMHAWYCIPIKGRQKKVKPKKHTHKRFEMKLYVRMSVWHLIFNAFKYKDNEYGSIMKIGTCFSVFRQAGSTTYAHTHTRLV